MGNKKLKNIMVFLLFLWLSACNSGSNLGGEKSHISSNKTPELTIDYVSTIPLINNLPTTVTIYVHNNTDYDLDNITYSINKNTQNSDNLSTINKNSLILCSHIPARSRCGLELTLSPFLTETLNQQSGSLQLNADYEVNGLSLRQSRILNFRQIRSDPGIYFSDDNVAYQSKDAIGTSLTSFIYNNSNSGLSHILDITSSNPDVSVIDKVDYLAPYQIKSLEVKITANNSVVNAELQATIKNEQDGNQTIKSALRSTPVFGGLIVAGVPEILNTSLGDNGSYPVQNVGDSSLIMHIAPTNGISITTGVNACVDNQELQSGATCIVYYTVPDTNSGNGVVSISYGDNQQNQTVINWFNSKGSALLAMQESTNLVIFPRGSTYSESITVTNLGGYKLTNLAYSVENNTGSAVVNIPAGVCTTLVVGQSCTFQAVFSSQIGDITEQSLAIKATGNYSNNQIYSRIIGIRYWVTRPSAVLVAEGGSVSRLDIESNYIQPLLAAKTKLLGVSLGSSGNAVAVGEDGVILHSDNYGESWVQVIAGIRATINSVSCNGVICVAAYGSDGTSDRGILRSIDGGSNWSIVKKFNAVGLNGFVPNAVHCDESGICILVGTVVGSGSTISLRSSNNGVTWVEFNNNAGIAVTSFGRTWMYVINNSTMTRVSFNNQGSSWGSSVTGASLFVNLWGVACKDENICFTVGGSGTIRRSSNASVQSGGIDWKGVGVGDRRYNAVSCASNACITVGNEGRIAWTTKPYESNDWQSQPVLGANNLNAINCIGDRCLMVGDSGVIYTSNNSGASWSEVNYGTDSLTSVSCRDAINCVLIGASGSVIYSNDNGISWKSANSLTTNDLNSVSCLLGTYTCLAVGNAGVIRVSFNFGQSWSSYTSPITNNLTGTSCFDSKCYAVGYNGKIIVASTSNFVFTELISGTGNRLNGISCSNANTCIAVGNGGVIRLTSNGNAWTGIGFGTADFKGATVNAEGKFLIIRQGSILLANNQIPTSGSSGWTTVYSGSNDINSIACFGDSCIAGGQNGLLLKSLNGGQTWVSINSGNTLAILANTVYN